MKMKFIKFSPKRFFPSKVSRHKPSSFGTSASSTSSSSDITGENLTVVTHTDDSSPYSHVELLKAFKLIDKDNDGAVSRHDLEALLSLLGPNPPSEDEFSVMLREVDREGHGTISLETLASRVVSSDSSTHRHQGSAELRETFEFFDSDRDGLMEAEELLRVFAVAIGDDRCTLEECSRMIAAVDEDGDGFVSFKRVKRPKTHHINKPANLQSLQEEKKKINGKSMIMKSEGQFQCNKDGDCDPRGCRGSSHVICKNHKCTCVHGAPIGGECSRITDCNLYGCPPKSRVICIHNVCECIPN